MTRDENGNLIRDPANPHGLPPQLTAKEHAERFAALITARDSAWQAADKVESVRIKNLRADGPVELPEITWWTA